MPKVRVNAIDLAYESLGHAADPTILLIHGLATPLTGWRDSLCQGLVAKGFRVVRFDNRDIGLSTHLDALGMPDLKAMIDEVKAGETPASPYRLEDMAADAAGLLDALGIASAHIVGASMGGMIAQLVAIHHPAKARSLVSIMSTTARPGLQQAKSEAMRAMMALPASPSREDRLATAIAAVRAASGPGFPASDEELTAYLGRSIDRTPFDPPAAARQMAAIIAAKPRNALLNGLRIPALILHGADDPVVPVDHGEDTARSIPGAKVTIVPGMGHEFGEALTPLYVREIGDFAAGVEAKRAQSVQ
jgi:pimeloyl-ACP methyl ester carboxylesterase